MSSTNIFSYENKLLAILGATFGFVFMDRLALAYLFPFMAPELKLTNSDLGMLSAVLSLMWAVSSLTSGVYSDLRGRRKTLLLLAVVSFSACSALSGLVTGFLSLFVFRGLIGFAEGPVLPLCQSLMVESSTPRRRGLNMGIVQGGSVGLLAGILGPPLIVGLASAYGWRHAFYVSCVPGLLAALFIWKTVREVPPGGSSQLVKEPIAPVSGFDARPLTLWEVLKIRNVWVCALLGCLFLTWLTMIISFAPTYLMKNTNLTGAQMSFVMSCMGAAGMIWGFGVPAISDRIGRKSSLIIFSVVAACCPFVMLYGKTPAVLGFLTLLTCSGSGCFTLFYATIPAESVPRRSLNSTLGFIMAVSEVVGGVIAPTLAGYAADRSGLSIVWVIAIAAAGAAGLLSLLLVETAPAVLARRLVGSSRSMAESGDLQT